MLLSPPRTFSLLNIQEGCTLNKGCWIRDGPLEKLWVGRGIFWAAGNYFLYQIPCMIFFQPIAWIFFRINWRAWICFHINFPCANIFFVLQNHSAQGQPSQAIPLNIARYRKAVYSALWVQGTLVVCYLPFAVAVAFTPQRGMSMSAYLTRQFTGSLTYLNSSLNPLLYCWKIREVRQAVKATLRQLLSILCWSR